MSSSFGFVINRWWHVGLAVLCAPAIGMADTAGLTFNGAMQMAVRGAPALMANAAALDSARQAAIPAGELPDPRLTLGVENLPIEGDSSFSFSGEPMAMRRIAIMQEVPNSAKREARVAVAQGRAELAAAETAVTRQMVLSQASVAWIARKTAERQLALIDSLVEENSLLEAAARARLAAGGSVAAEAMTPRIEAALIEQRRDDLVSQRKQAISNLRRWVGPAADSALAGDVPDWRIDLDHLLHDLHQHPEIELYAPRSRVVAAEIAEARAATKPDWAVGFAYQNRAAQFGDMVALEFTFDLPLFTGTRQEPMIAAKSAERKALDAEREAAMREHSAQVEADVAEYQRLSSAVKRQREVLIPLASEKASLALAAWRSGKGGLTDVVAARSDRIDMELAAIALEGERQQLAARMYYLYSKESRRQP